MAGEAVVCRPKMTRTQVFLRGKTRRMDISRPLVRWRRFESLAGHVPQGLFSKPFSIRTHRRTMGGKVAHITRQLDFALRIEPLRHLGSARDDGLACFYDPWARRIANGFDAQPNL